MVWAVGRVVTSREGCMSRIARTMANPGARLAGRPARLPSGEIPRRYVCTASDWLCIAFSIGTVSIFVSSTNFIPTKLVATINRSRTTVASIDSCNPFCIPSDWLSDGFYAGPPERYETANRKIALILTLFL